MYVWAGEGGWREGGGSVWVQLEVNCTRPPPLMSTVEISTVPGVRGDLNYYPYNIPDGVFLFLPRFPELGTFKVKRPNSWT